MVGQVPLSRGRNRDIVVIGASAGGLDPLKTLLAGLPADLPAALFVVVHIGATSHLPGILDRVATLPAAAARTGEAVEHGRIYVAPPGRHLLLHDGHVLLRRGPRENLARPAIDPLFRSAACSFGARVIGVVLSGALNDGTVGLRAIKSGGGVAVVQDPADAAFPDMPQSALRYADIDHTVPAAAMAELLARLVGEPAGETPEIPMGIRIEAAISAQESRDMSIRDQPGTLSPFTCPECSGSLWELADGGMLRYRCHVGHAFTADILLAAQAEQVEQRLWTLLRTHEERAELVRRLAGRERERNRDSLAAELEWRAEEYEQDAELLRGLLRDRGNEMSPLSIAGADPGEVTAADEQKES